MRVLGPDTQINFYLRLESIRETHLAESLALAVESLTVEGIDHELARHVPAPSLSVLARNGLRGETFFAVPSILRTRPTLLGYYRLLYGLSQKAFYSQGPFRPFKKLEDNAEVPSRVDSGIPRPCESLAETGSLLLSALPAVSLGLIHELQLLTVGPQFRGGRNTDIGQAAVAGVFQVLRDVAHPFLTSETDSAVTLRNSAGRVIAVIAGADPDIRVEDLSVSPARPVLAVEIKGGGDISNIHNRIGEAEKSHQKAQRRGFNNRWTILGARVDPNVAKSESPSTTRFFDLDSLSEESSAFRQEIAALLGIPAS